MTLRPDIAEFIGGLALRQAPPHRPLRVHLSPCPGERKGAAAPSTLLQLGFRSPGQGERWPEGSVRGWFGFRFPVNFASVS
jgi:hypothetical protein